MGSKPGWVRMQDKAIENGWSGVNQTLDKLVFEKGAKRVYVWLDKRGAIRKAVCRDEQCRHYDIDPPRRLNQVLNILAGGEMGVTNDTGK
jgi:hypothetical protein